MGEFCRAAGAEVFLEPFLAFSNYPVPLLVTFLLLFLANGYRPSSADPGQRAAAPAQSARHARTLGRTGADSIASPPGRVRNLLALEPGQVIETQWAHGEDLPLAAGDVQLAWSEFEVVDSELAVRVTRLA
jgi:hypothetical protein